VNLHGSMVKKSGIKERKRRYPSK